MVLGEHVISRKACGWRDDRNATNADCNLARENGRVKIKENDGISLVLIFLQPSRVSQISSIDKSPFSFVPGGITFPGATLTYDKLQFSPMTQPSPRTAF